MPNYSVNYDENLVAKDSLLNSLVDGPKTLEDLLAGIGADKIRANVFGAIGRDTGIEFEVDKSNQITYVQSKGWESASAGFRLGSDGTLEIYASGVLRASFGTGMSLLTPAGLGAGSIYSLGTNQIDIDVGGASDFEFNETAFEPLTDNAVSLGSVGGANRRWSDVRSVLINGADIGFQNGWKFREYPLKKKDVAKSPKWMKKYANQGIQLLDDKENVIAIFHRNGNIYCKGIKPLIKLKKRK